MNMGRMRANPGEAYRVFLGFSECSVIVQYMCHFLSSTVTLYTGDWCYSRVLLAFQINCRFGVGFGRACSQHTNVTDITSVLDDAVRRGSPRGVIFLPIFSGQKQFQAICQAMYQAISGNAVHAVFSGL